MPPPDPISGAAAEPDPTLDGGGSAGAGAPKRVTLVMLSGGIDSVWTLLRLLIDTDDEIFAHHVHMLNPEGRHVPEGHACRAIVERLRREVRPFHYSETSIDHRNMRWFGFDIVSVGFEAGICAHSFHIARGRPMDRWTIGTCEEEGHDADRFAHVEAALRANCYPLSAPPFFLLPLVPKAQEIAELGPELSAMCWTCRRPSKSDEGVWTECGACKTCRLLARVAPNRSARPGAAPEPAPGSAPARGVPS